MAASIGRGTSFFGLPVTQGKVLYLDVDTPLQSLHKRVARPDAAPNVWWLVTPPLSIPFMRDETPEMEELRDAAKTVEPDVVFVNTLRKVHDLDDKEPRVPKLVYSFFTKLFPNAAVVYVHHEKKHPSDPRMLNIEKESFSGAKNWLNDAQVGVHLEPFKGEKWKENLRLWHRKSQVSALLEPLPLFLGSDGKTLTSPRYEELFATYSWLNEHGDEKMSAGEKDVALAALLGVGTSTAKKRRLSVENGEFPGSTRFLEKGSDE